MELVREMGMRVSGAFYRSRLFWLGAVVFVFLTWAWWDSGKMGTEVSWGSPVGEHAGWLADGGVCWEYRSYAAGFVGEQGLYGGRHVVLRENSDSRPGFAFPAAFGPVHYGTVFVESEGWKVAVWLVMVIYVVVWLGAVVWWQRRKARVMKLQPGAVESGGG